MDTEEEWPNSNVKKVSRIGPNGRKGPTIPKAASGPDRDDDYDFHITHTLPRTVNGQ